jgi:hypothetical protein
VQGLRPSCKDLNTNLPIRETKLCLTVPELCCSLWDKLRIASHINELVHKSQWCDIVHRFIFQLLRLKQDKFMRNIEYVERHIVLLQIFFNLCVIRKTYFTNNVGIEK